MTFAILVRDWLILVVWGLINQSTARIIKTIMNSENFYLIYLLRLIDIQTIVFCSFIVLSLFNIYPNKSIILVEIGCRTDSECPSQTACINQECVNPCAIADPCGENAQCQVIYLLSIYKSLHLSSIYQSIYSCLSLVNRDISNKYIL